MDKRYTAFRCFAYALELVLLFVLQTTPGFPPEILGGRPLLLLPAAVTIAFLEPEVPALCFGAAAGIMLDLAHSDSVGFFAFTLTLICFIVSIIFRDYMVVSFLNATAFISVITAGLIFIYFMLFFVFAGRQAALLYFARHYISRILYTALCGIPLFYFNRWLYKSLRDA